MKKPTNLFFTDRFWLCVLTAYISLSPAITELIKDPEIKRSDIAAFVNTTILVLAGLVTKLKSDKEVYTPKFLPGRDKKDALLNIEEPVTEVIEIVQEVVPAVLETGAQLQDINSMLTTMSSAVNELAEVLAKNPDVTKNLPK